MSFNSRTREGCDLVRGEGAWTSKCFNSRTREGCDLRPAPPRPAVCRVSIHAPGRGATQPTSRSTLLHLVSIHAPGRGATIYISVGNVRRMRFNSRTREGCDSEGERGEFECLVSIHAPGRGATSWLLRFSLFFGSFNSRTREGCDSISLRSRSRVTSFNSRTREGCDSPSSSESDFSGSRFNSRTREGCDVVVV